MQWVLTNALHLLYSNNTTVGNNVATHDGMLSARLFYWILNSPDLLDVNSPTNRSLTIVELGAGRGCVLFWRGQSPLSLEEYSLLNSLKHVVMK